MQKTKNKKSTEKNKSKTKVKKSIDKKTVKACNKKIVDNVCKTLSKAEALYRLVALSGGPGNLAQLLGLERISIYQWIHKGNGISRLGFSLVKSSQLIPDDLKWDLRNDESLYPMTDPYMKKFDKQKQFEEDFLNGKIKIIIPFMITERKN